MRARGGTNTKTCGDTTGGRHGPKRSTGASEGSSRMDRGNHTSTAQGLHLPTDQRATDASRREDQAVHGRLSPTPHHARCRQRGQDTTKAGEPDAPACQAPRPAPTMVTSTNTTDVAHANRCQSTQTNERYTPERKSEKPTQLQMVAPPTTLNPAPGYCHRMTCQCTQKEMRAQLRPRLTEPSAED